MEAFRILGVVPLVLWLSFSPAIGKEVAAKQGIGTPQVVGGMTPDRRPEGLPKITATGLTMSGLERTMRGISEPYPPHLDFIDDQGGWYTPFSHPGMTGPYDIRNLHGGGK